MSSRTSRRLVLWSGWIGLLLAAMPFYKSSKAPWPPDPVALPEISMPIIGAIPQQSTSTRFTLGLPFSPWFRFGKNLLVERTKTDTTSTGDSIKVTTADGKLAPQGTATIVSTSFKFNYNYSWGMSVWNGSTLLAVASMALLIVARQQRRSSQAVLEQPALGHLEPPPDALNQR